MPPSRIAALQQELAQAGNYAHWKSAALELDRLEGADTWKLDDASADYDHLLIKERLSALRRLRADGAVRPLVFSLHEGLHGNIGNITNPALYAVCRVGTKLLIEHYLHEVVRCLDFVCAGDFPDFSDEEKLAFFETTSAAFGRSALLLSGGATLGMFHLGVIKALADENLLPRVLSGSSAGAIIAGMVATRSDDELPPMFEMASTRQLFAFERLGLRKALSSGGLMEAEQLRLCIQANMADLSFEEAWQHSQRSVGISVSAFEPGRPARLLNHLTAPNVLLHSAIQASCAVPGVFPPVTLEARNFEGEIVPYLHSHRWVDGSLSADLPMLRLSRLHNVNHYIVSQTNPHVVPFLRDDHVRHRGLRALVADIWRHNVLQTLKMAGAHFSGRTLSRMADRLGQIVGQNYSGDISVFPQQSARQLAKLFSNPTHEDMVRFIGEGERSTWPRIERIRNQTLISRTFDDCLGLIKERLRQSRRQRRRHES